jgi:hypothetical protein
VAFGACGRKPVLQVPSQFAPYVQKFEQASTTQGPTVQVTDLIVKFGAMENQYERGICELDGDNTPTILVNEDAWDDMSEDERESLIFHELGHCVLKRKHRADQMGPGIPASLMNPYTIPGWTYEQYKKYYIEELFSQKDTI